MIATTATVGNLLWAHPMPPQLYDHPSNETQELAVDGFPDVDAAKYARIVTGEGWPHYPKDEQSVLVKLAQYESQTLRGRIEAQQKRVKEKRAKEAQEARQKQFDEMQAERDKKKAAEQAEAERKAAEEKKKQKEVAAAQKSAMGPGAVHLASLDTGSRTDVPLQQPGAARLAQNRKDNFMMVSTDKVEPSKSSKPLPPRDAATHFVVTPGVSYYRFQMPDFGAPISLGAATSAPWPNKAPMNYNLNKYHLRPTLGFDYSYANPGVLPALLGDRLHILGKGVYSHASSSSKKGLGGATGFYWFITGGADPRNDAREQVLNSAKINLDDIYGDLKLSMSGDHQLSKRVVFKPRLGLAYTYLKQEYDYDVQGTQTAPSASSGSNGSEVTKSYYFGPLVGAELDLNLNPSVSATADLEVQGLHANTHFDGDGVATIGTTPVSATVKSSDSLYTYRSKLALGIHYYVKGEGDPKRVKLSLLAGVDFWGYIPEVINPQGPNSDAAHTKRTTALNNFVNLSVAVPLM